MLSNRNRIEVNIWQYHALLSDRKVEVVTLHCLSSFCELGQHFRKITKTKLVFVSVAHHTIKGINTTLRLT